MTELNTKTFSTSESFNKCAFCGRPTNYFFQELNCYICPSCLGEYKKASTPPVYWDNWQTGDRWQDRTTNK